ncbi:SagB/ThcOx family dehydrogenase [Candidatus Latescibacterota bacterium]
MNKIILRVVFMLISLIAFLTAPLICSGQEKVIKLEKPSFKSDVSVEEALRTRRSVRDYSDEPLTIEEISQLLWAGQGITNKRGFRTNPSAGAAFPMELYLASHNVTGVKPGLYHYSPQDETLTLVMDGSLREQMSDIEIYQKNVRKSAAVIIITGDSVRMAQRHGIHNFRYICMEAGSIFQSIGLQAQTLGLGTVVVGAFNEVDLKKMLGIKEDPLIIMPLGRKK